MNCNGQRVANYVMLQLNASDYYNVVAEFTTLTKNITSWSVEWTNGKDPSDTPLCGFDDSLCPGKTWVWVKCVILFYLNIII